MPILWEEMENKMVILLAVIVAFGLLMPQAFSILVLCVIIGTFLLFN